MDFLTTAVLFVFITATTPKVSTSPVEESTAMPPETTTSFEGVTTTPLPPITASFEETTTPTFEPSEGTPDRLIVVSVIILVVIVFIMAAHLMVWKFKRQKANRTGNSICPGLSIVNTQEDITGLDNQYIEIEEPANIPVLLSEGDYLSLITDAGYITPLPTEPEPKEKPGPVINVSTKMDVLNNLPAKMREEVMEFVMEVEGLNYIRDIGKGHFGKVYLCQLIKETQSRLVAVKSMNGGGFRKPADVEAFIQEALKIKDFRNNFILSPLGIIFHQGYPKIILPYMENGDLRSFLANKMSSNGGFEQAQLLHFCCDVAEGMSYLSRQRFAHMDLAARNCMVDSKLRVKVGDFGMTHDLYEKSYYRMSQSKPLPVRWMSLETITENKYTCKSDVWSYGVVMWEIFTHGEKPYKHLDNRQLLNRITTGEFVCLEQPDLCPSEIYSMMCKCWTVNPEERPRFSVMKTELESFITSFNQTKF